jgi:hypothetical protein
MRNAYKILLRRPEIKRRCRRPGHRGKDNYDIRSLGHRLERCGLNASGSEQGPVAGSRRTLLHIVSYTETKFGIGIC